MLTWLRKMKLLEWFREMPRNRHAAGKRWATGATAARSS